MMEGAGVVTDGRLPSTREGGGHRKLDVETLLDRVPFGGYQWLVFALCFLIVLLDGFDTAAIGYIAPSLMEEWQVPRTALAPVLSAALFGLAAGALSAGPLADRFGRKRVLVGAVLIFGATCLASSASADLQTLTWLRFVTGVGLGAAMPNAVTLMSEFSPRRRRAMITNAMFCGFPLGASCGGFLAAWLIPEFGWRSVLVLGGVLPLVLALVLLFALPESVRYMVSHGWPAARVHRVLARMLPGQDVAADVYVLPEADAAAAGGAPVASPPSPLASAALSSGAGEMSSSSPTASGGEGNDGAFSASDMSGARNKSSVQGNGASQKRGIALVLSREFRVGTLMLWLTYFMGLVVFYAMINWLPVLFRGIGIDAATASRVTALFPLGGVAAILLGWLMDRFDGNRVLAAGYAATALSIWAIGQAVGSMGLLMAMVFVAGVVMNAAQAAMPALAAHYYPTRGRATGVAWMLGVGRFGGIAGSFLVAALAARDFDFAGILTVLAVPGLIATAALLFKMATDRK